ncbi:MAG: N-acetyltransferase [Desulfobacteraceae bacterium]|nr:MAG: N-acetyltransferase [Desulfobacteraceae bacterium]
MNVLETERLNLRELTAADAEFMLGLLNEPSFLRFIGDRGVRTLEDSRQYILKGPVGSYARHGFGMWLVALKESQAAIGLCGLVKRDFLPDVDIGFAFLPGFWSQGYAYESAAAVKAYAISVLGLKRLVAIVNPDNLASAKLLEKIGLRFERMLTLPESGEEIRLFVMEF